MLRVLKRESSLSHSAAPVLVLLHGLGSNEHDLMALAPQIGTEWRILSIGAPYPYAFGGFAWFEIEWGETGVSFDADQAQQSQQLLIAELESIQGEGSTPTQIVIGGFSQGAIMSLSIALAAPQLVSGVVLLSGAPTHGFGSTKLPPGLARLPFLIEHGVEDPVLPVGGSREIAARLREVGSPVSYHEYPAGHTVTAQGLVDLSEWLDGFMERAQK